MMPDRRTVLFAAALALVFARGLAAQAPPASPPEPPSPAAEPWAPDTAEPGSVEAIRRFTTAEEYLPETVAYVPDSPSVPSPTEVLGHLVGAPDRLSRVSEIHGYFQRLAAASPRVRVETIGTSEEGREILLAEISSEENLGRLDRLREVTALLADPRKTPRSAVPGLVAEGRPFYYLLGGLHSTETGSPEMLMELAYRLAVSERPEIRRIRDRVVVLVTPVVETDGRDRVVEWYERNLAGRDLPYEELREIASPPYWGHYAFHDNNRDGMQRALASTRAVQATFFRDHPQVMHDLHESVPLLYISTGHGPYSRAVDPVTVNEWTEFAHHEAGELAAMGLPGVWVWGFWDGWWPGYLVSVANNHNSIGRFYETFGNSLPGTYDREVGDDKFAGKAVTEVQWYRPWPPEKKLRWSLRDNTNYMEAAVLEALVYASLHGAELLENGWRKAARAIRRGRDETPHAYLLPIGQRDPSRLAYLVNQLRDHGIEVHRLREPFTAGGRTFAAGSYVVRLDQPYRNAALNFLEEQKFPADEPNPPYDDVAWTWPLLWGVDARPVDDPAILAAAMEPVDSEIRPKGAVEGTGEELFLLADHGQTALLTARILFADNQVDAVEEPFEQGGVEYPAGSWVIQAPRAVVEQVARVTGLTFGAAQDLPAVRRHVLDLPRLGVVHTWTSTQDAGWARWALDRAQMPYSLVSPDDLRRGGLAGRFDVLLFPDTRGDLARMVHGLDPALGPLPYSRSPDYPSQGIPDASPDITGGMGFEGILELQRFVEGGGVLVALGNAGTLAVDGGLVRRVEKVSAGRTPGSVLRAKVARRSHPIVYGYPEQTSVFRGNDPLWDVPDRLRAARVVLQLGTKRADDGDEVGGSKAVGGTPAPAVSPPGPTVVEEDLPPEDLAAPASPEGGAQTEVETVPQGAAEGPPAAVPAVEGTEKPGRPATAEKLVLSGYVESPEKLDGKPAILDLPTGRGRVVLFAFDPLHRGLDIADFRFVWNVLLNWNDLPR